MLAVVCLAAGVARAETNDFPAERYRTAIDAGGVLSVEAGAIPQRGSWNAGLWLGFARNPLVAYGPDSSVRAGPLVANRLGVSVYGAYSLLKRLEVGLEAGRQDVKRPENEPCECAKYEQ